MELPLQGTHAIPDALPRAFAGFSAKTKGTKIKVGFFGVNSPIGYRTFRIEAKKKGKASDNGVVAAAFDMLPCDCID